MMSPAAQHRKRISQNKVVKAGLPVALSAHDSVVIAQFNSDLQRLAVIRSRSCRNDEKRAVLKRYEQWVSELMLVDVLNQQQKAVFVWLLLWRVDVGRWVEVVEMAAFALRKGMSAPEGFKRTLAETISEQIADGIKQDGDYVTFRELLDQVVELVANDDMTDQIKAKLYKACGLACLGSDKAKARLMFNQALELNPNVGVIRLLRKMDSDVEPKVVDYSEYGLSARETARFIGVSLPTVLRYAKRKIKPLPHIVLPKGTKTVYRFKFSDVKNYKKQVLDK